MSRERFLRVLKFVLFVDFAFLAWYFLKFFKLHNRVPSLEEVSSKFGLVITLSSLLVYLFDKCLWKYFPFKLLAGLPQIEGEWSVEIKNLADGKLQKSKMKIEQTYFNVSIEVEAERGNSKTITGDLIKINSTWRLIWTWESINKASPFYGTTILDIREGEKIMEGLYFTNSKLTGDLCTTGEFVAKKLFKE
jgi:hypothetical protein